MCDDEEDGCVYLSGASLAEIELAARKLCIRKRIAFDPLRIGVGTDYGTRIAIYIMTEDGAAEESA